MASKLQQLQLKARQASQLAYTHGSAYYKTGNTYYKKFLEENKKYVQEPPTVEKCNELAKQLFYTRLASIPIRREAFWKEIDSAKQRLKNLGDVKVEEAATVALFGLEIYGCFFIGEIIGRGFTITGYYP